MYSCPVCQPQMFNKVPGQTQPWHPFPLSLPSAVGQG